MVESLRVQSEARLRKLAGPVELNNSVEASYRDLAGALVNAGYSRTKGGERSGSGREIFVRASSEKLILRIRDDRVELAEEREKAIGLYVYGFSTDSSLDIEDREFVFTLPRDPSYLSEEMVLEVVSVLGPEGMKKVTSAISNGGMIGKNKFYKEHSDYMAKLRASRMKAE